MDIENPNIKYLIKGLDLEVDTHYPKIQRIARTFKDGGLYTMSKIFKILESKYRKPTQTFDEWIEKANLSIQWMDHYDLIKYEGDDEGHYRVFHKRQIL